MLTFAAPMMLLGLFAVAAPLLAHLLGRGRIVQLELPTVRLLHATAAGRRWIDRWRDLLLLLVRLLVVASIVILFARPVWNWQIPLAANDAMPVVIVLDTSASMRAVTDSISRFERSRAMVRERLRRLPQGSRAGLVFMDAAPDAATTVLTPRIDRLQQALDARDPGYERASPIAALRLARDLAGPAGQVIVYTDAQLGDWQGIGAADLGLAQVHAVHGQVDANAAIETVSIAPDGQALSVRVAASGNGEPPGSVLLDVDRGEPVATTLPPGAWQQTAVQVALPSRISSPTASLQLPPDAMAFDNRRYVVLRQPTAAELLLLAEAGSDTAFYLARAMSPQGSPAVKLVDATANLKLLAEQVRAGATLVLTPAGPWSQLLTELELAATVGNARVGDGFHSLRPGPDPAPELDWLRQDDAALSSLGASHWLSLPSVAGMDVVLQHADGSVAVAAAGRGAGRILLLNLAMDHGDSLAAVSPALPAMLQSLIPRPRPRLGPSVIVGEAAVIEVEELADNASAALGLRLLGPDGRELQLPPVDPAVPVVPLPALTSPGFYELQAHNGQSLGWIAANVHPDESDLQTFALSPRVQRPPLDEATHAARDRQRELWPGLAVAALVLCLLETLVRRRMR